MNTQTSDKVWTKDEIKEKLLGSQKWLEHGIVAIYRRQTMDEQASFATLHLNGIGFNGADAEIMSSFAKRLERGINLSERQVAAAKKIMPKYAGQLAKIANGVN